jgi:hypothetical protein
MVVASFASLTPSQGAPPGAPLPRDRIDRRGDGVVRRHSHSCRGLRVNSPLKCGRSPLRVFANTRVHSARVFGVGGDCEPGQQAHRDKRNSNDIAQLGHLPSPLGFQGRLIRRAPLTLGDPFMSRKTVERWLKALRKRQEHDGLARWSAVSAILSSYSLLAGYRRRMKGLRVNTTPRSDAFHGTACCGSYPTGHAKSQAGNRCSRKHNRLRAFALRTVCGDNAPKVRATRQDHILPPRVQCRRSKRL